MLGIVNKEHFHPHREVKKPKGSEKQVSKEGDGEPSPKKARVEEPETTTVKKVYFPTPALFLTWEQPLLCILHPTPPHPPFLSLLSCTNQSFKIHHTIICYFKHSFSFLCVFEESSYSCNKSTISNNSLHWSRSPVSEEHSSTACHYTSNESSSRIISQCFVILCVCAQSVNSQNIAVVVRLGDST